MAGVAVAGTTVCLLGTWEKAGREQGAADLSRPLSKANEIFFERVLSYFR
jgi:hypothetical protein